MICKLMGNHRTRNMSSNLVCNHMLLGVVIRATQMNLPDLRPILMKVASTTKI